MLYLSASLLNKFTYIQIYCFFSIFVLKPKAMKQFFRPFIMATLLIMPFNAGAQTPPGGTDSLLGGFMDPPKSARPRVWWHWMNGNITKEGIRKDLLWMDEAGVVGFHNFDAGLETPQIVERRISYMTPEWKDCFNYAIDLADSLDMEVTIAASPGWSETGGPWVSPDDAMKKLVWRQVDVQGPSGYERIPLPEGFDVTGRFQDAPMDNTGLEGKFKDLRYYRDIAVLAVKLPEADMDLAGLDPEVTASGLSDALSSGELLSRLNSDGAGDYIPVLPSDGWSWIQYRFDSPQTVKSLIITEKKLSGTETGLVREFQCSDDGTEFRTVAALGYQATRQKTYNIPPTTARYFRIRFKDTEDGGNRPFGVARFVLSTMPVIQDAGDKAGFGLYRLLRLENTPEWSDASRLEDVVDLTDMFQDGILTWKVPEGRWRIFRFGYSLTGKANHPATEEATGLEVDKLDPEAVRSYLNAYLDTYRDASDGRLGPGGIEYLLTDSYEAGPQTWTRKMFEEFESRNGYGLLKWMPALTGMILKDSDATERFLFDWRRTIGAMLAEYHYDLQNEVLKPLGMKRYTESHENWRANLTDGMDCKRYAEVPMSAFWMQYNQGLIFTTRFEADIRESASVAHIYGQNIAAAESFTTNGFRDGAWVFSPAVLKPTADAAMAAGLNRFVIHTSPHQPVDDKFPGLGLGPYGQWFDRHETWSGQARAWTDYLSRSCYMLQQGRFIADIAYYYGEDNNVTGLYMYGSPEVPREYNYDFFSPSVLKDLATPDNGDIVVPSGMRYKVLMLDPNVRYMSLPVLRKIKALADAGVTICGSRPEIQAGNPTMTEEFGTLVKDVWESGRKNVTSGIPVKEVLESMAVAPDFMYTSPESADIKFVHRHITEGDIYWIANLSDKATRLKASFRVEGKIPVIWHAEDGSTEPAGFSTFDGRIGMGVDLDRHQSVFVVFLEDTDRKELALPETNITDSRTVGGPWDLNFQEGRGAPGHVTLNDLGSLSENEDPGIRYFSGEVTYRNSFKLGKKDLRNGTRIILELGEVKDIAEVRVNGVKTGAIWTHPFRTDITDAVRKGRNLLEIKAVNVWHNRIVGDVQPDVREKVTYTPIDFFTADEPLLPSGLLGPVKVILQKD